MTAGRWQGGRRGDGQEGRRGGGKRERSDAADVGGAQKERGGSPRPARRHARPDREQVLPGGAEHYLKKAAWWTCSRRRRTCCSWRRWRGACHERWGAQRALETALPKRGGAVVVLVGEHRGKQGTVWTRKGEVAAGAALSEELSVHKISPGPHSRVRALED